jgi:hypothetical protein
MALHVNGDGTFSDGVKIEGTGSFLSHQIGLACVTAVSLTVPAYAVNVIVQSEAQPARYRLDGIAPTATTGVVVPTNGLVVLSRADAVASLWIQTASAALLNVSYTL